MFEMTPDLYTGIEQIDKEHERLFELAEETYSLLHNCVLLDKEDQIVRLTSELIDYTRSHFAHEEAYMKRVSYENFYDHYAQHKQFESKLAEIDFEELEGNPEEQDAVIESLLEFLASWLVDHIKKEDLKISMLSHPM
ncbi:MAG: hemerythrin family protein [Lachnospiraceae bacterium]|nr:hemerythrin family protein [Lachnospiraceae bacterium]